MPLVGLGTWKSKDGVVGEAVKAAIAAGYRHIDCAHCYDNEHEVGAALQELFEAGTVSRDELFIVSKLWNTKHEERDVERALRHTLSKLRLDRVDLYLVHWPTAWRRTEGHVGPEGNFPRRTDGSGPAYDYEAPREDGSDGIVDPSETWRGMEGVYAKGLARAIGVSNFSVKQLEALAKSASVPCMVNQVESHPLLPQREMVEYCSRQNIAVTAYSPLGSPDNVRARKESDPSLLRDEQISKIGGCYGKSAAQVLVRFHTQRGVVAIPKSKTPAYMAANLDTFDFTISDEHMAALIAMEMPFRYGPNERDKAHPHFPWPEEFATAAATS
uniref:NADP-dependent oxidoreductase domain-containing protein n=1 Tax=Prymnesium polylepis TaxID=72548 RepID=A0A6V4LVG3_9EUKA